MDCEDIGVQNCMDSIQIPESRIREKWDGESLNSSATNEKAVEGYQAPDQKVIIYFIMGFACA